MKISGPPFTRYAKRQSICQLTNAIFYGRVECVDDGRSAMSDPVALVDWLSELLERVLGTEEREIEDTLEIVARRDIQFFVELLELCVVKQLIWIGDVRAHRVGLVQRGFPRFIVHPIDLR